MSRNEVDFSGGFSHDLGGYIRFDVVVFQNGRSGHVQIVPMCGKSSCMLLQMQIFKLLGLQLGCFFFGLFGSGDPEGSPEHLWEL